MKKSYFENSLTSELTASRIASLDLAIAYAKKGEFPVMLLDKMCDVSLMVKMAFIIEAIAGKNVISRDFSDKSLEFGKNLTLDKLVELRNSLMAKK